MTDAVRGQGKLLREIADRLGCDLKAREMKYKLVNFGSANRSHEYEVLVPESDGALRPVPTLRC